VLDLQLGNITKHTLVVLLLTLFIGGCTWKLDHVTEALERRHIQSCIITIGFPWPFTLVHIVTATGGATIEDCSVLMLKTPKGGKE
jgi:hypothetical protein